ncbi:MAG: hypothetical protein HDS67_02280 [Bacteroidales bacterium]|nr:hypothetical protein [Bacteroidales bacterium]
MSKQVYFNDPQRLVQLVGANTSVIVAGRRTGKTDSIAAPFVLRCMQRMPRSCGGIVVPTYKHGLTNTIPGMLAAWKRWGWIEGVHFVVGKKPPKSFADPIRPPFEYKHVISFYNGSYAVIISQDRPGSSNSLTLSWLLVDEARFVDYDKLKNETLPANGGIKVDFGHCSANHAMMVLSDMPQGKRGSWFLNYREKMDPELIEAIKGTVFELWKTRERILKARETSGEVPAYLRDYRRRLDRDLNKMRSVAVFYKEYSSIENLQLLGEKYIAQMKRDLPPLTFQTSILCRRLGIAKDGFYSSMREHHIYDASDLDYLDSLGMSSDIVDPSLFDARADRDVDPDAPIMIGMDYNANINWIVAGQVHGARLDVIKSFYTKFDRKIPALIADFCAYYSSHRNKRVIFYYDSTALGANYAVNDQDFRWVIINEFQRLGWSVDDVYLGNPMRHDEKYLLISQAFSGKQRLTPFFNRQNNEDLLIAIQSAGVSRGRLGFRKNKAGEKLAESEEDLLEHRTDGTDAFDTLYIGAEKFPQSDISTPLIYGIH